MLVLGAQVYEIISFVQCSIDKRPNKWSGTLSSSKWTGDGQTDSVPGLSNYGYTVESPAEDNRGNVHTNLFLTMTLVMLFAHIWF